MKTQFIHIIFLSLIFLACGEVFAQRKDNTASKKPVLTNKYRLKKRVTPTEGTKSKGSEKIPNSQTVQSGHYAGQKRYVESPQVLGQSQFRGSEPLFPREPQKGFATFRSKYKFLPHKLQTGFATFKSKTKFLPHKLQTGFATFKSKTKFLPHQYRRGYDKFISSYAFLPTKKKFGHDKFISNYKFRPHEYRRGYDEFTGGAIKYGFLEKRRKAIIHNTRKMQNYSGTVRYVDWKKVRMKRSHRMATSLGALKIRYSLRKSKLSNRELQKYRSKPYNVRYLRKGKFMWKKDMPRYQRYPEKSPRYNPTERQGAVVSSGKGEILYPSRGEMWVNGKPIKRTISGTPTTNPLPLNAPSRTKELKQMQKENKIKSAEVEKEPKQD
ncbi:hypothetical protein [Raineya orbicola]|uniref:Uncharacterized protein n=1 Tax=Raineya orbicola TaxID=2016530 RepID=A0A2N3IIN4_9BACT|nr:hypothetical protein [Raineya orbicola]PKQ70210.1 hypothetical protein Rain11_0731 [Raineya orbicola]